jgi:N-methylhydantoinase A/acetophenone carboxylase
MYTIDIDTGGTFTDGYLVGDDTALTVKVETTPHDLTLCFSTCIDEAARQLSMTTPGLLQQTRIIRFSSTVTTNIAVQMSGPKLGLLVTVGNEQALYDGSGENPAFKFIPPDMVAGIDEEVGGDGRIVKSPRPQEIDEAIRRFLEQGARTLVISLRNAHLNPGNEIAVRRAIDASYPRHYLGAVPMLTAHQISRMPNDAVRTNTAVVNAYFHRALATALYRAEDWTRRSGYGYPLLVVTSDYGVSRVAKTRAITTYHSGPASCVRAAQVLAGHFGDNRVLSIDVGGTTSDVAFVVRGKPPSAEYRPLNNVRVAQRVPAVVSFGVGGGSRLRVAADKTITVGPDSQGAAPGPACFGLGGTFATPTDLWLTLGYLAPDQYLGGRKKLQPAKAEAIIKKTLADPLGLTNEDAAWRAKEAVEASLANQILAEDSLPDAKTISGATLYAVGGGAGLLAVGLAQKLGMRRICFPATAAVFSAFGSSTLDVRHQYEEIVPRKDAGGARIGSLLANLRQQAERDMTAEGFKPSEITFALDIEAFVEGEQVGSQAVAESKDLADAAAAAIAGLPGPVDGVVIRMSAVGALPRRPIAAAAQRPNGIAAAKVGARHIRLADRVHDAPLYRLDRLPAGARLSGPAIAENDHTSILLPSAMSLVVDAAGGCVLELP